MANSSAARSPDALGHEPLIRSSANVCSSDAPKSSNARRPSRRSRRSPPVSPFRRCECQITRPAVRRRRARVVDATALCPTGALANAGKGAWVGTSRALVGGHAIRSARVGNSSWRTARPFGAAIATSVERGVTAGRRARRAHILAQTAPSRRGGRARLARGGRTLAMLRPRCPRTARPAQR